MKEMNLRNFKKSSTGVATTSFETANGWVMEKEIVNCCGCNERGTFITSPIKEIDIKEQTFITKSGSEYKVVGMDEYIREIIVNCFTADDGTIIDTLSEVSSALDEGKNIRCSFILLDGAKLGETSYIKSIDVTNSKFVTQSGSIYVIPNP